MDRLFPSPFAVLLMLAAGTAAAGSIRVAPTWLELTPERSATVVTITNSGTAPTLIQLEAKRWNQKSGTDEYIAADELILSPPIFTLQPGAEQLVRIGSRAKPAFAAEESYRLFVQEVPTPAMGRGRELSVVLRIGVPLFVVPTNSSPAQLRAELACDEHAPRTLLLQNTGGRALRLDELKIRPESGKPDQVERGVYVLAGSTRALQLQAMPADVRGVELDATAAERKLQIAAHCP
jgi:fimbrial chaperone protein